MNMMELGMNEMEQISAGTAAGGVSRKPRTRRGYIRHKITATDTVWGLAKRYHCTMDEIVRANPSIRDRRLIRTNYWLYIPKM